MRALLFHDLAHAARAATLMPQGVRAARLGRLLERAHAADKYRKATGRAHPVWGDGTLAQALRHLPLAPAPRRLDADQCTIMFAVLAAVIRWHEERGWN